MLTAMLSNQAAICLRGKGIFEEALHKLSLPQGCEEGVGCLGILLQPAGRGGRGMREAALHAADWPRGFAPDAGALGILLVPTAWTLAVTCAASHRCASVPEGRHRCRSGSYLQETTFLLYSDGLQSIMEAI